MESHTVPYGICERIFRIAFFQFAVQSVGWIEQMLIYVYRMCERKGCPAAFDDKRMDQSLEIFKRLGAKEHYVIPEDGKANIHMITMRASDLEQEITRHGGQWVKVENEYRIIPPKTHSEEWDSFQKECLLNKTGWSLQERLVRGEMRQVIVTCENAHLVDEWQKTCFLHIHYPFIRHRERAGFYLGMKKDCAFYDLRGTRYSQGTPSEKGTYLTADAVLKKLQALGYKTPNIWVSGSCKTASIGAYLKMKYHEQGINFVSEQSYIDLETEMIDHQPWPARLFAKWNLSALNSRDIPSDVAPEVTEDYYNTAKKWENLSLSKKGKVVIIHANKDGTLPEGAEKRYFDLAQRVNTQVYLRYFNGPEGVNAHNVSCFTDRNLHREFMQIVFGHVKPDQVQ